MIGVKYNAIIKLILKRMYYLKVMKEAVTQEKVSFDGDKIHTKRVISGSGQTFETCPYIALRCGLFSNSNSSLSTTIRRITSHMK